MFADTIAYPGAVVIHSEIALVAHAAVMGSYWLYLLALKTVTDVSKGVNFITGLVMEYN